MQACLNEGMRVYPPVPTLTREAERGMELGGYHIEKGTMLGVAVFSMHNNPAYWKVCRILSCCASGFPCTQWRQWHLGANVEYEEEARPKPVKLQALAHKSKSTPRLTVLYMSMNSSARDWRTGASVRCEHGSHQPPYRRFRACMREHGHG